jgi:hypothetical protein
MKFDVLDFFESLSRNSKFHSNLTGKMGTLREDLRTFMTSRPVLLRIRNVSDKSCRKKLKRSLYAQ